MVVGITDAKPIDNERLLNSDFVPFVSGDLKKRTNPLEVMKEAKSIVVVCVPQNAENALSRYILPTENIYPSFIEDLSREQPHVAPKSDFLFGAKYSKSGRNGNLSSLGTNQDYHTKIKTTLASIAAEIKTSFVLAKTKALTDSPTLCERSLAVRAGLGFFGKNGLLYTNKYGSLANIGLLLTDICPGELSSWVFKSTLADSYLHHLTPGADSCSPDCDLCIKACPNAALEEGKPLNAKLCVSYLTQKDNLNDDEGKLLHGQLFGCDICQNVCPLNKTLEAVYLDPQEIYCQTDGENAKIFENTALNWKIELLRRNAGLALHNAPDSLC